MANYVLICDKFYLTSSSFDPNMHDMHVSVSCKSHVLLQITYTRNNTKMNKSFAQFPYYSDSNPYQSQYYSHKSTKNSIKSESKINLITANGYTHIHGIPIVNANTCKSLQYK